jgi:hypothetical protein
MLCLRKLKNAFLPQSCHFDGGEITQVIRQRLATFLMRLLRSSQ